MLVALVAVDRGQRQGSALSQNVRHLDYRPIRPQEIGKTVAAKDRVKRFLIEIKGKLFRVNLPVADIANFQLPRSRKRPVKHLGRNVGADDLALRAERPAQGRHSRARAARDFENRLPTLQARQLYELFLELVVGKIAESAEELDYARLGIVVEARINVPHAAQKE
jgi:hypothetical protein